MGKLLSYLKESGKANNTIIIYISDNGMAFPGAKTNVYEPGLKLPCIISSPFIKHRGTTNDAMISWVDMTPTILDMAGVDISKEDFMGRSFLPILDGEITKGWDKMYASHTFHEITMYYPMRAMRKGDYKIIWNIAYQLEYPFASDLWVSSTWQSVLRNNKKYFGKRTAEAYLHRPEFELYNLKEDPDEINNLATKKEYADILEEMKNYIKKWQLKTKDPWYIMWNHDASLQGAGEKL
jgi:N-sulfoglucosamine sulfohydrolase